MSSRKFTAFECIEFVGKNVVFNVITSHGIDVNVKGVFTSYTLNSIMFKGYHDTNFEFRFDTEYYFIKVGPAFPKNYEGAKESLC